MTITAIRAVPLASVQGTLALDLPPAWTCPWRSAARSGAGPATWWTSGVPRAAVRAVSR